MRTTQQTITEEESLHEYLLVAQDRICVECFSRAKSGGWKSVTYESSEDALTLPAIDCRILVRDVYDKVRFR